MDSPHPAEESQRFSGHVWRFADCELDELRRELRVRGRAVEIEAKPWEVLRQLLRHAGEVVTKDELLESVWPGVMVVDGSLATAVSKLRKALADDSLVVTLPRVGYRLAAPVESAPAAAPPAPTELRLAPGDPVPGRCQWRMARRLARSPSGEVWLAEHPKTRERRVFKFAPDAARLKGLKREVTLARLLRESLGERPEFVRILEWNFDRPPYFLESEYCGPDLAEWAEARGGLAGIPLDARLLLLADVARAVAEAHGLGVLHKDLKPGNILVSPTAGGEHQVKVADFGSAALLAPSRLGALGITNMGFTQTEEAGSLSGTVMYVAPEVIAGQSPTPASDVYALGVLLYQLTAGDFRRPLAPGWEADVADPLLREDISAAACGDPARRLKTAAEFAERLTTLDRRRAEREERERDEQRAQLAEHRRARVRARRPWLLLAGITFVAAAAVFLSFYRSAAPPTPPARTVAILPFQNVGSDPDLDHLRLALPDEVATTLSHMRGLAVRPFAATRKYDQPGLDLQQAGREMRANSVVTGHFSKQGGQLHVTLEAVDVETDGVLWRDKIAAPAQSMIASQVQLSLKVRAGLGPALGATAAESGAQPKNEEAYDLFLRSLAVPADPAPNREGISLLERAVELDPGYAPAWLALARRYYTESHHASGSRGSMERYDAAIERALALDPDYVAAGAGLVLSRVERGDIGRASREAEDLVRRRPDSADAHFVLSYALRFAGLLEESADHCETALFLDPNTQTSGLRSCAMVFLLRGDYPRALNFLNLDPDSALVRALYIDMLVRQGKEQEALRRGLEHTPQWAGYDMLLACIQHKPEPEIRRLAAAVQTSDDPETNYISATHLAYCDRTDAAFEMLRRAVEGNYCSYPAIESDPYFATLRAQPKFGELRSAAVACRNNFLAQRSQ
jgi:serine/threonine protein kinase/DNA-binding winged helix-turn-helix (wHTH) protein